jgi:hypothetical protein
MAELAEKKHHQVRRHRKASAWIDPYIPIRQSACPQGMRIAGASVQNVIRIVRRGLS